eukprot:m.95242 g.95242  ORF g.95242 m.95242 type:complete len:596 (+) comp15147_c0_seq2:130-1917(+)
MRAGAMVTVITALLLALVAVPVSGVVRKRPTILSKQTRAPSHKNTKQTESKDVFTSSASVFELLQMEKLFATQLRDFVAQQRKSLERVENAAAVLESHKVPLTDLDLEPQDGFLGISRVSDALSVFKAADEPRQHLQAWLDTRKSFLPDETDLKGAASSILRLQRTYKASVSLGVCGQTHLLFVCLFVWFVHCMFGSLAGRKSKMLCHCRCTVLDKINNANRTNTHRFSSTKQLLPDANAKLLKMVGVQAYRQEDFYLAFQWLHAAYDKGGEAARKDFELLDHLAFASFKVGDYPMALEASRPLLQSDDRRFRRRINANMVFYEQALHGDTNPPTLDSPNYNSDNLLQHNAAVMEDFRRLCRGEPKVVPIPRADESCEYLFDPEYPLDRIAVEHVLSERQDAKVFRDFLSPVEADGIVQFGKDKLARAVAFTGSAQTAADFRISATAWLHWDATDVVERVHRRIARATGLDIFTAEQLQLSNYGVGGHYEPHMDWGRNKGDTVGNDRLATFMLYLSDVKAGGSTVFPRLGVAVKPSKGDAIYWVNLLEDGEGDTQTLHAGCPVLAGSKWVANKWFHLVGSHKRQCHDAPTSPAHF